VTGVVLGVAQQRLGDRHAGQRGNSDPDTDGLA